MLGGEKETSLKFMFEMSVLDWGIQGLSLSCNTEQGCCQWHTTIHKVCVCSLQGCVHTAGQTAVLVLDYNMFLPQWGKDEDNPWSVRKGRGADSAVLEPFLFRRFISHNEDMPLGRAMKGLSIPHWLNFHSKLDKDFKTLRDHSIVFSSLSIDFGVKLTAMPICCIYFSEFVCSNYFWIALLLCNINEVAKKIFQFSHSSPQVILRLIKNKWNFMVS